MSRHDAFTSLPCQLTSRHFCAFIITQHARIDYLLLTTSLRIYVLGYKLIDVFFDAANYDVILLPATAVVARVLFVITLNAGTSTIFRLIFSAQRLLQSPRRADRRIHKIFDGPPAHFCS